MKKFAFQVVLFIFFLFSITPALLAQSVSGRWSGTLSHGGNQLKMFFTIDQQDQQWKATLDVPAQGARDIPVESVVFRNDSLFLKLPPLGASYAGKWKPELQQLEGEWRQSGMNLPLVLERTEEEIGAKRPQNPEEPYKYHSEIVLFENPDAGVRIAGTFTRPKEEGLHPAVILVSGSGPQDRDGTIMEHKPMLVLGDYLTRKGFAVLRYDDRGFGQSTGNFVTATTEDFASDAVAAFDYLQYRTDVDARKIGVLGMSEGGLIAPMVATQKPLSFLVLLAPPVLPGKELLMLQVETLLKKTGVPEAELQQALNQQEEILEVVLSEPDNQQAAQKLEKLLQPKKDSLPDNQQEAGGMPASYISGQIAQLVSPWYRFFLAYDPATAYEKVDAPVLALFGSKDLQVPAKENAEALKRVVDRKGKSNYTIEIIEGVNHLFQPASTGLPIEYNQIETTISPKVLEKISTWIEEQALPLSE